MDQMVNIEGQPDDALLKMTSEGLGLAQTLVSSINRIDIKFKVVSHGMIGLDSIHELLNQAEPEMIAISQQLRGDIQGHALFLMNDDQSMQMMRYLLKESARLRELTEMEEEALMEFGNIIINSCLARYLEMNNGQLNSELPTLERDHFAQILDEYSAEIIDASLFYTQTKIELPDLCYTGYLFWTRMR